MPLGAGGLLATYGLACSAAALILALLLWQT